MSERNRGEILTVALPILGLLGLSLLAFTDKQRRWIRKRDNDACQLPGFKGIACDPKHLEVDHIIPQRYGRETLGMEEAELDQPLNALTLCRNHHRGHPKSKHPDAHQALYDYQRDHDSFKKMFKVRDDQLEQNQEYWNGDYDAAESALALRNTRVFTQAHPEEPFPKPKHKK